MKPFRLKTLTLKKSLPTPLKPLTLKMLMQPLTTPPLTTPPLTTPPLMTLLTTPLLKKTQLHKQFVLSHNPRSLSQATTFSF